MGWTLHSVVSVLEKLERGLDDEVARVRQALAETQARQLDQLGVERHVVTHEAGDRGQTQAVRRQQLLDVATYARRPCTVRRPRGARGQAESAPKPTG